jgi:hypothetical protein
MTYWTIPNLFMFINWKTNVSDDYILRITDGGTAVQVEVNNRVSIINLFTSLKIDYSI